MILLPASDVLSSVYDLAHEITLNQGDVLAEQFAKADYFYFLLEGKITFHLNLEEGSEQLLVGFTDAPLTPIGWSGLISPNRYATTAKIDSPTATLLCWEFSVLEEKLRDNHLSVAMIRLVCSRCTFLIKEAIDMLSEYAPSLPKDEPILFIEDYQSTKLPQEHDIVQFLRKSPFFEIFQESQLEILARHIERRQYHTHDVIYEQGTHLKGIYMLVSGKVTYTHNSSKNETIGFRNMITPGFMVGWSAAIDAPTLINATAKQETVLYFIPKEALTWMTEHDSHFARELHYRLLWLIGHQLQAIRSRLISVKFNKEIIAINNLIEQNSTNLDLCSELHQVPHLLQNKLTIEHGINILHRLKEDGDALERNISALCLDTVREVSKELQFYKGLVSTYQSVVKADDNLDAAQIRKICAVESAKAFENASSVITGWENLPDEPGHIFIYNHLRNHPFNTLPNNFQIALDSHFLSGVIMNKKYDDPGVRIVRIGRGAEYAHQNYYERLGHIDVYTNESDPKTSADEYRDAKRKEFFDLAHSYLENKTNLLICPEGTSYGTDESPGAFKSGAFRLALTSKVEPLIVPIAIANFDKRIRKNTFSIIIHKPFKVSDYINDANDKTAMKTFLKNLQKTYAKYVVEAIEQSKDKLTTA
jgi:CRP-like cAMP-binding protein